MTKILLTIITLFSFCTSANQLEKLCADIEKWEPGQEGPAVEAYGKEMQIIDFTFAAQQVGKKNWLLVDTRGEKERAKGLFENVISLRAGLKADDPDDYKKEAVVERIRDYFNNDRLNWAEISKFNFMLFCNGAKCPKSARAACSLRKMGVPAKNINVLPISYEELLEMGLPLYFKNSRLIGKSNSSTFIIRLLPGMDLKKSLVSLQKVKGLKAASVISVAGSLKQAKIRFADQSEPTELRGPLEIVGLGGTLGDGGAHLHISVADKSGKTTGGHLVDGNPIYTTAEIVILESKDLIFHREKDTRTGYDELFIESTK